MNMAHDEKVTWCNEIIAKPSLSQKSEKLLKSLMLFENKKTDNELMLGGGMGQDLT
jgi:predicted Mrr-cat superfamily restriction endonuclease